jgi:hypothetical protein
MNQKGLLKNHVSSTSALELAEGFVQSQNNIFFLSLNEERVQVS